METISVSKTEVNAIKESNGPKYFVNIEGVEHDWPKDTITTEEIAQLGGWGTEGVIEIDADNVEHTLAPSEIVHLKPGHGFAKKIRWQRGDGVFDHRLADELHHLQGHFKNVEQQGNWFIIRDYVFPEGWSVKKADIAFRAMSGYPGTPPYGFFVPTGLRYKEAMPTNYQDNIADVPPFAGQWGMFSWSPTEWRPSDDLRKGFNLLNFAFSFMNRLQEGA